MTQVSFLRLAPNLKGIVSSYTLQSYSISLRGFSYNFLCELGPGTIMLDTTVNGSLVPRLLGAGIKKRFACNEHGENDFSIRSLVHR